MNALSTAATRDYRQNHIYAMHRLADDLWCPLNRDYMPLDRNWQGHPRIARWGYGLTNDARAGELGHGGQELSNEDYSALGHEQGRRVTLTEALIKQVTGEHPGSITRGTDGEITEFFLYWDGSVPWSMQPDSTYLRRESILKEWLADI